MLYYYFLFFAFSFFFFFFGCFIFFQTQKTTLRGILCKRTYVELFHVKLRQIYSQPMFLCLIRCLPSIHFKRIRAYRFRLLYHMNGLFWFFIFAVNMRKARSSTHRTHSQLRPNSVCVSILRRILMTETERETLSVRFLIWSCTEIKIQAYE